MNRKYMPRRHKNRSLRWTEPSRVGFPIMTTVSRVPRKQLIRGAVVWAHVPYAEDEGEKTRPAVVVQLRGRDVTLLPATTSQSRHRFPGRYVEVKDLPVTGLSRGTAIRTTPVTVDIIEILNVVGALSGADIQRILGDCPGALGDLHEVA